MWAKRLGGLNFCSGNGIAVDDSGDVYVTGSINGNVGSDVYVDLNGDGDTSDLGEIISGGFDIAYIAKFDPSGTNIWYKRLATYLGDGLAVAVDAFGSVYITGYTSGDIDLNGDGDTNDPGEV